MYIDPFWVGAGATLCVEIVALIVAAIIMNMKGRK